MILKSAKSQECRDIIAEVTLIAYQHVLWVWRFLLSARKFMAANVAVALQVVSGNA